MAWLGGNKHCYSIEKKTRIFVDEVLKFAFAQFQCLDQDYQIIRTDMEVELKVFGEIIKPDYQVMRCCQSCQVDGVNDLPLYVIEVKRTDGKKSSLLTELDQHFKQLRYICIQHGLPFVNGVITDYKDWYFTRFSLSREIEGLSDNLFELSEKFAVLKWQSDNTYEVNR